MNYEFILTQNYILLVPWFLYLPLAKIFATKKIVSSEKKLTSGKPALDLTLIVVFFVKNRNFNAGVW